MPRSRILYASEAIFAGPAPATGFHFTSGNSGVNLVNQLQRIQSAGYGVNISRQDVLQYGQLSPVDRIILQAPTVNLNLDYIVANTYNANTIGFVTDGSSGCMSNILNQSADTRNYFIETVPEGSDADYDSTDPDSSRFTIGIGNGYLSSFSAEAAVGQFATEKVTIEGLNFATYQGTTGLASPAVIPASGIRVTNNLFSLPSGSSGVSGAIPAVRFGDITVSISNPTFGPLVSDLKIQSYNLSLPLTRQPIMAMGSPFPVYRPIQFPVHCPLVIEAELGDLQTGDITALLCNDSSYNLTVTLRKPQCGGNGPVAVQYSMVGAKLDSQNYTSSTTANKKVSLHYSAVIGGPTDTLHNVNISGSLI